MTATTTLAVEKIDVSQASKEVTANEAFDAFDAGFGQLTKALSDANYTLSDSTVPKEWNYGILYFTGALTAGRNIVVPTNKKTYVVINGTTGGFALTVKTSGGTGVAVSSSTPRILRCDGTNVVELFTVPTLSAITPNAQTGTTYTYVNGDNSKLVTHSNASAIAGTLPQAGSGGDFTNGWFMFVQNRGAGTLTITPTTSTIDGAASLALTTGQGALICSDGTNYFTERGTGSGGGGGGTAGRHTLTVWGENMFPSVTAGCAALNKIATSSNRPDIVFLGFDTTIEEYTQFHVRMPKRWDEGTVTFAPIWSHGATTVNFGVVWSLQAVATSDDDTIDAAFGTAVTSVDTGGTTNDQYTGPESSAMTIAGTPAAEDVVRFRCYRTPAHASDTLAVDARLEGVTIYYTTNAENDA